MKCEYLFLSQTHFLYFDGFSLFLVCFDCSNYKYTSDLIRLWLTMKGGTATLTLMFFCIFILRETRSLCTHFPFNWIFSVRVRRFLRFSLLLLKRYQKCFSCVIISYHYLLDDDDERIFE